VPISRVLPKFKEPKVHHYEKNSSKIVSVFGDREFDKFAVAELCNISSSGAYKFLTTMVVNGVLTARKIENNKLIYTKVNS
jgi:hypothetical protein